VTIPKSDGRILQSLEVTDYDVNENKPASIISMTIVSMTIVHPTG
jgi:hypothetical protein